MSYHAICVFGSDCFWSLSRTFFSSFQRVAKMAAARFDASLIELEDVIVRCSSSRRADVLRQVVVLFVSPQQREWDLVAALDEVLVRLSHPAETRELIELSDAIARSGLSFPKLAQQLASSRDAAVAGPILRTSASLSEHLVREVAETRAQEHLLAISWRPMIPAEITAALVMRGNAAVHRNLSRNHGARFSDRSLSVLLKLAERDEQLAEALAGRPDLPPASVRKFLSLVKAPAMARFIAAASPQARSVASEVVERHGTLPVLDYSEAMTELTALSRSGKLTDAVVNRFAVNGNYAKVVAALALLAESEIKEAADLFFCQGAEALAIACKAARLRWATAAAILRSRPNQFSSQTELQAAQELFERVSLSEAQRRVRFGCAEGAA